MASPFTRLLFSVGRPNRILLATKYASEEENRYLTMMSLRHSRSDPHGKFTRVQIPDGNANRQHKIADEEENQYLTTMAIRHSRSDPTGEFTHVDFSKTIPKSKIVTPSSAEEDTWLTKMSEEFAKKS